MITSLQSDKVKFVVRLQQKARFRSQEGLFVCEGKRLVQEVPKDLLREVYVESGFFDRDPKARQWIGELRSHKVRAEEVSHEVMARMAGVVHSQGILAVVRVPAFSQEELFGGLSGASAGDGRAASREKGGLSGEDAPLLILLDNLQDPGNMGTILRTAEAAGVTGVISSADSVDFYSPKVVRSTMGGIFRVPHLAAADLGDAIMELQGRGVKVYGAMLSDGCIPYDQADYTGPSALVVGNEGEGIRDRISGLCDRAVRIPMAGKVESLNAGVAAGILLYEAARQRSGKQNADLV